MAPFPSAVSAGNFANPNAGLIHGMLSSVEGSYTTILADHQNGLLAEVDDKYVSVYGFDSDWSDGIDVSGGKLVAVLNSLAACGAGNSIDILAHSEGVPVSLYALTQAPPTTLPTTKAIVKKLISIAGPILGTPIANVFGTNPVPLRAALETVFANVPAQQIVLPSNWAKVLPAVLGDKFPLELETNNSSESSVLSSIRSKLDQVTRHMTSFCHTWT